MSARPAPQTHSDLDEVQQQVQMASMDNEPISAQQLNSDAPPLSRNVVVSIRASLDDLCNESSASRWAPSEGALRSMFRQRRFTSLDGTAEAQGDLSSIVLHDLSVTHVKSTFPVSVGANIFATDPNSYASDGQAYSLIVPASTDRAYNRSLQKDPTEMAYGFAAKFPGFTSTNLETKGVHKVDAKSFVLITADHPIISAISENSDKLQLGDVAAMPEGMIKVSSSLYNALLPMVKAQVASQIRVRSFKDANVTIHPPDHSGSWSDVRRTLINESVALRRRELEAGIKGTITDDDVESIGARLREEQQVIEQEIDNTKYDFTVELTAQYQFLADEMPAEK